MLFADDKHMSLCNRDFPMLINIINRLDKPSTWFKANRPSLNLTRTTLSSNLIQPNLKTIARQSVLLPAQSQVLVETATFDVE